MYISFKDVQNLSFRKYTSRLQLCRHFIAVSYFCLYKIRFYDGYQIITHEKDFLNIPRSSTKQVNGLHYIGISEYSLQNREWYFSHLFIYNSYRKTSIFHKEHRSFVSNETFPIFDIYFCFQWLNWTGKQ